MRHFSTRLGSTSCSGPGCADIGGLVVRFGMTCASKLGQPRDVAEAAIETSGLQRDSMVVCFLEQAQDLPENCGDGDGMMDPYVTFHVVQGDPMKEDQGPGLAQRILSQRSQVLRKHSWEIGKSKTEFMDRRADGGGRALSSPGCGVQIRHVQ